MISPLNPSLLTGSVVKSLGYCSLSSSGARFMWEAGSRQRCILLSVVFRSGVSPFQGPLDGENKGLESITSGLYILSDSVSSGGSLHGIS